VAYCKHAFCPHRSKRKGRSGRASNYPNCGALRQEWNRGGHCRVILVLDGGGKVRMTASKFGKGALEFAQARRGTMGEFQEKRGSGRRYSTHVAKEGEKKGGLLARCEGGKKKRRSLRPPNFPGIGCRKKGDPPRHKKEKRKRRIIGNRRW